MGRAIWKDRSWWQKFAWQPRIGSDTISLPHGLHSEEYFRNELVQEGRRARRSNSAVVVMMVDAEHLRHEERSDEIMDALGQGLNACMRGTDICGLLKDGSMIGVILTEIEAGKIELAKQKVAEKFKKKAAEMLGEELAHQIETSFLVLSAPPDDKDILDKAYDPDSIRQAAASGPDRYTTAEEASKVAFAALYDEANRKATGS